ncbi:MAG: hypothetical protein HQ559_11160 [Lentisphaerae bacterium]|nr:hypothetical protein [Lentisphaerota bacterium]
MPSVPSPRPAVIVSTADRSLGLPVTIGVPFLMGSLHDPGRLVLRDPGDRVVPVSAKALVSWPDGSVRWGLLTFEAREPGVYGVDLQADAAAAPAVEQPVTVSRESGHTTIDNGLVRVVLDASGPGPISEIRALGHRYLADASDLRFAVDGADTRRERQRTIEVTEESELRVRVRVEGAHFADDGARLLNYRLDVELWANWPAMRIDYHFMNLEPGHDEIGVDRLAMEWHLNLDAETRRHFEQSSHGMMFVPREVFNADPVAIVSDDSCGPAHVEDPAMLLDETDYPPHLRPPLVGSSEWMGVGDGKRSVYMRMRDFIEMRPKRLASHGGNLEFEFWPASQGRLALPQGRTRRQTVAMAFSDEGALVPAEACRLLESSFHEGRAVIAPAWLRACGEFEVDRLLAPGVNIRFEKFLRRLVTLSTPQSMFDLGDTVDSGYCRTYAAIPNNSVLKQNAPAIPRVFSASMHSPLSDRSMPDLYEPVWTNNEYDAIYVVCSEIMRSGRNDLWPLARWAVRHNIEVDFVHYHDDKQQNRATPQHSCRHNTSGSIPSHYWTQGLLQYYCMTGDPDVLEVAMALGDKIIEDFTVPEFRESFWGFTRELGWPTLALAHLFDITGERRYRAQLEEILEFCMQVDRGPRTAEGQPTELESAIAWGSLIWSCMFEGADRFLRSVGRADLRLWLEEFLQYVRISLDRHHREGTPVLVSAPMVMAIGYELTGDERFLHTGMVSLDEFIESSDWVSPRPEIKPMAIVYRGLIRFLNHAHTAGLLQRLDYPSTSMSGRTEA